MQNFTIITSVLLIHVLAWLTPGPNLALIIRNSLVYSRKAGFWTAMGFALSNVIHITYSVFGIGYLISSSPLAQTLIKSLGVAYLIYLGIRTAIIKSKAKQAIVKKEYQKTTNLESFRTGLITNLLSPKAPPFFISIFGSLLASRTPFWVIGFLYIAMPLNTLMMASLWTLFFSQKSINSFYNRFQSAFNKLLGFALIILALIILFS
jgi:threonine/homoserine/homoserine lactone efflux protein